MSLGTQGLAFTAGILSTLSPCVLPLLPIVIGTAASQHRYGPAALAAGLAASFVTIGLFVATIGFSIGLDADLFRNMSAVLLLAIGVLLVAPPLQHRVAAAAGPMANWLEQKFGGGTGQGLWGQAGVGLLLGAVWSPCVGPTLGAASVLASQGKDLAQVALTMAMFGIGAALPLLILGMLSREAMMKVRGRMLAGSSKAKALLGAVLIAIGVLILTGYDKKVEAALVDASPAWLTSLTTKY